MKQLFLLICLCLGTTLTLKAQRSISGTVAEADGTPMIGASVLVKGTSSGSVTDVNGYYELTVPKDYDRLIVSYTGFDAKEVSIGVSSTIDIILSEGITLETAVVTALGIERSKKALTYSVEQVSGDALTQSRETNLVNALGGKVSGVFTSASGGQAGSSARVVIRGNSSFLGNNQPLFVIDGVPVDNSQTFGGGQNNGNGTGTGDSPLFYGGTSNRAVDIDPSNIESMSVLKGASATALYGSRAANGVILISTKNGQQGSKPTITFSSNYGISDARLPEFQTKYAQGRDGIYSNGAPGQLQSSSWGPLIDTLRVDEAGNVDPNGSPIQTYKNPEEFFQRGFNFDNNLAISGGNEKSNFYVSYANRIEEGIVRKNELDRHTFLAKFNTKVSDKIEIGTSISYSNSAIATATEGNGRSSYMWTVYGAPNTYNLQGDSPTDYLNPDGTQRLYRSATRNNPYFVVDNNGLVSNVNRFLPNVNFSLQLADGFKLINRLGADIYSDHRYYREVIGTQGSFPTGRVYEDNINYHQFNNDLILKYTKAYDNFDFDILVGHNINQESNDRIFTQGINLSVPDFFDLSNASTISTFPNNSKRRLIGAYAAATVGYKNYLYLTATARNDWSSTLLQDNRSYFYPSISGSLILSDAIESLQSNSIISFLKIRAGYAEVGNDPSPYGTQTNLYTQSSISDGQRGAINIPLNGQNSFTISNVIGNPTLEPERTNEIEVGLEMNLFRNRIRMEGSYYDKTTSQQIFQAPIAGSSGAVSRIVNAGSLKNNGVELLLEFTPIKTNSFTWDLGGTFTKNTSTVEELTDGVSNIRLGGFTNPGIYIVKDQGYGVIWGSQYQQDEQGRTIIDDDPTSGTYGLPTSVANGLGVIGKTQPDWYAGIRNTFTFGNDRIGQLSLHALVDIRQGGDILNLDNFYLNFYGTPKHTEDRTGETTIVYPNGVLSDGSPNNIEVPLDQNYWRNNVGRAMEDFVEDGSYVRLREVSFSYNLPKTILAKTFVQDLNITFTGRNLYLHAPNFTGADPEASLYGSANGQGFYNFITPGTKGYNVSLNATF